MGEPKVFLTWEQLHFVKSKLEELKQAHVPQTPDQDKIWGYYREGVDDSIRLIDKIAKGIV